MTDNFIIINVTIDDINDDLLRRFFTKTVICPKIPKYFKNDTIIDGILTPEQVIERYGKDFEVSYKLEASYYPVHFANKIEKDYMYTYLIDLSINKIVGSVKGRIENLFEYFNVGRSISVDEVCIYPEYIGKGFCSTILDAFLADYDGKYGNLLIATDNPVSANKCYDKSFLKKGFIFKLIYLPFMTDSKCTPDNDKHYLYGESFKLNFDYTTSIVANKQELNALIERECIEAKEDLLIHYNMEETENINVKIYTIK
jgi:hypothetical protein